MKRLLHRHSADLVRISTDGDVALWTGGRMRKARRCSHCDRMMKPGENAFRPIGNQMYRSQRICAACVDGGFQ